jgi:hypothetical protein
VHCVDWEGRMLAGVQESEKSVTGAGLSVIVTLFVTPL